MIQRAGYRRADRVLLGGPSRHSTLQSLPQPKYREKSRIEEKGKRNPVSQPNKMSQRQVNLTAPPKPNYPRPASRHPRKKDTSPRPTKITALPPSSSHNLLSHTSTPSLNQPTHIILVSVKARSSDLSPRPPSHCNHRDCNQTLPLPLPP
jgi:hypothetical protein